MSERVLFVVSEDWYFVSHRLPLARRLRALGHHVTLAARFARHREALEAEGIRCVPIALRRTGSSIAGEVAAIEDLRRLYRRERPTVIHLVALKPVVFGGLAALGLRDVAVVNAIAGLGFLFSSSSSRARIGRAAAVPLLRLLLGRPNAWIIVQNPDDEATLARLRIGRPGHVVLIRGAGVDRAEFHPTPEAEGEKVVLYAGRMLRDKGVADLVAAARLLRDRGVTTRVELVGEPDPDNPASHSAAELEAWQREGIVAWRGRSDAMPAVLAAAHVVCLPTVYGEGVPKILIEAAASGRAIVASDWPGCREIVRHGENGLLVPPRDPAALADALERLLRDDDLRRRMAAAGARIAGADFSLEQVTEATLALYRRARA